MENHMRQKLLLMVIFISMLFQTTILPTNATNRWDYVLKDYSTPREHQIINGYLNEFHKALKDTWYTPLYRRYNARCVIFYLNKDGSISNIEIYRAGINRNPCPYTNNFDNHIRNYLSEIKFKPFPECIKGDKIKMGYIFAGNYTMYYTMAGSGAVIFNKGEKIYNYIADKPQV